MDVIILTLHTKKIRFGERKGLAQGHVAIKWQKHNLNPDVLTGSPMVFLLYNTAAYNRQESHEISHNLQTR